MKLRPGRVLIPDVTVFAPNEPDERFPAALPLVVIEILAPEDRHTEVHRKLQEYRQWGVPNIWLIDPELRKLYVFSAGLSEVPSYRLPEYEVEITPDEIFA